MRVCSAKLNRKSGRLRTVLGFILALAMVFSTIPVAFAADASAVDIDDNITDFVLVVDCSATMAANDPNGLCQDACKMFIDLIPELDTRVGVIAFGYKTADKDRYEYQNFKVEDDTEYVHTLVPLQSITDVTTEDNVKDSLAVLANSNGTQTTIGEALLAAVDMLESAGSQKGQSAIILMSDGAAAPYSGLEQEKETINKSVEEAKANQWPIYCVQLNFDDQGDEMSLVFPNETVEEVLTRISSETEAGAEGRREVMSPSDVGEAFLTVFDRFFGGNGEIELENTGSTGKAEHEFTIPNLVSETAIVVVGNGIDQIDLINVDEGTTKTIKTDMVTDGLIVSVEDDSYYSIKLICPKTGNWKIIAYGDPGTEIVTYNTSIQELALTMKATASTNAAELTKNDTVSIDSYFVYSDYEVHNNDFYADYPASLIVVNEKSGASKEYKMTGDKDGYHYNLSIAETGSGNFSVHVLLESTMFRSGRKTSNSSSFKAVNLPATLKTTDAVNLEGSVNNAFDRIDINDYVDNPDGDPLTYDFYCTSDRTFAFDSAFDNSNGYLDIKCGMIPGEYTCELTVSEADKDEPLVIPVNLTVKDSPVELTECEKISIWIDSYGWQKEVGNTTAIFDAADYATDPDGVPISIVKYETVGEGDDEEEDIGQIGIKQNGTELTLTPEAKGKLTLNVTVTDGVKEYTETVQVKVISGKALYWKQNSVWIIPSVAVLIIAVIVFVLLLLNKKVKGTWSFTLDNPGNGAHAELDNMRAKSLSIMKDKHKFTVRELMDKALSIMDSDLLADFGPGLDSQIAELRNYRMSGVIGGVGCVLECTKKNENVKATYGGKPVKKCKMTSGAVTFEIDGELEITMRVRKG